MVTTADDVAARRASDSATALRAATRGRRVLVAAAAFRCLIVLSACTGDDSSTTPQTAGPGNQAEGTHVGFKATVVQQRLDVGTRRIGLELTSDARTTAHVNAFS